MDEATSRNIPVRPGAALAALSGDERWRQGRSRDFGYWLIEGRRGRLAWA